MSGVQVTEVSEDVLGDPLIITGFFPKTDRSLYEVGSCSHSDKFM